MDKNIPNAAALRYDQRKQQYRIQQIVLELQDNQYPNCSTLAERFEVSPKTILRDIEHMRSTLNLPIEYDPAAKGYFLTKAVDSFPLMQVTEGELVALLMARKLLSAYRGTVFEVPLQHALDKLQTALRGQLTVPFREFEDALSARVGSGAEVSPEIFTKVCEGMMTRKAVEMVYQTPDRPEPSSRAIHPWHITVYRGSWYVVAWCTLRQERRTFLLSRIREARLLSDEFTVPDDFSIEAHLKGSFRVWYEPGQTIRTVRVRFTGSAAKVVAERHWHPSQQFTTEGDATIVTLELGNFIELKGWLLSWGDAAELLEPADWREAMRANLQAALGRYG